MLLVNHCAILVCKSCSGRGFLKRRDNLLGIEGIPGRITFFTTSCSTCEGKGVWAMAAPEATERQKEYFRTRGIKQKDFVFPDEETLLKRDKEVNDLAFLLGCTRAPKNDIGLKIVLTHSTFVTYQLAFTGKVQLSTGKSITRGAYAEMLKELFHKHNVVRPIDWYPENELPKSVISFEWAHSVYNIRTERFKDPKKEKKP